MSVRVRHLFSSWLAIFFAAAALVHAAPLPLPERPADGVHDDAHLLTPEQRTRILAAFATARAKGLEPYLAVFSFIGSDTVKSLADRLQPAWGKGQRSLVIVYETGSGNCDRALGLPEDTAMAIGSMQEAFNRAAEAARDQTEGGAKVEALILSFVPEVATALERNDVLQKQALSGRPRQIFIGVAIMGVLIMLVGWLVQRAARSRLVTGPPPAFFPSVAVDTRFGGAFGGGSTAEVSFRR